MTSVITYFRQQTDRQTISIILRFNDDIFKHLWRRVYIYSWPTVIKSDPKAPISVATTPRCRGGSDPFTWIAPCSKFWKSLVEVEWTYWGVVKLFNTQNKLMDVHQSDISKILRYLLLAPPNGQVWHKAFFGGSGRRAETHTRPAFPKNAYGLVGIPLIMGASGAGRSNPTSEGSKSLGGRPPEAEENYPAAETHPARSAPQPARPAEVRPDNWIGKILRFSTSNFVFFIFIKSRHFTQAYLVLLHKTNHTSCVLFFWFPCAGSRESTPVSSR